MSVEHNTERVFADEDGGAVYVLKNDTTREEAVKLAAGLLDAYDPGILAVAEVTVTPCKGHPEYDLFYAEDVDGPGTGWPDLEPIGPHAAYWKVGDV